MNARIILTVVFICVCITAALGCTESPDYGESTSIANEDPVLEILEHHPEKTEFGNVVIVGKAKAYENLAYAEVNVKFYDKNGALLSTSLDNINNLESGEIWNFEVMYFEMNSEDVTNYKIFPGTCW